MFAIWYAGKEFAMKKTAFHNREFQIHKKFKHMNIIKLNYFMFGMQQLLQRRRYFCYHFMPRISGDLVCMAKPDYVPI